MVLLLFPAEKYSDLFLFLCILKIVLCIIKVSCLFREHYMLIYCIFVMYISWCHLYLWWDIGVTTHYLLIHIKASSNMCECVTKEKTQMARSFHPGVMWSFMWHYSCSQGAVPVVYCLSHVPYSLLSLSHMVGAIVFTVLYTCKHINHVCIIVTIT